MAGASAVQIGTAVMARGLEVFAKVASEIAAFLDAEGYAGVKEVVGAAHG
jgi:dihydroorotate dehydrogenase